MINREDIAENLKKWRKQSGIPVKEIVSKLKLDGVIVSEKTYYGWESGHRQPDADTFLMLCNIFNIRDILSEFSKPDNIITDPDKQRLNDNYDAMNQEGKTTLVKLSDDMASSGNYKQPKLHTIKIAARNDGGIREIQLTDEQLNAIDDLPDYEDEI